ncbi:MAG: bifunctional metallophosphatase/5'-nucleotidase [Clostridiales bacterium]|nr:bifunctional metallophosphatase/5'-nucleotidase [Clostridiales bacterium]
MNKRRSICTILVFVMVVAMLDGLAVFPAAAAESGASTETVIFVHTNDVHGHLNVEPYVKAVADAYKAQYGNANVLTVSAGDVFAGGEAVAHLTNGESVVEVMNEAGYDALAVGNNDIPNGLGELIAHDEATSFPILCANLVTNGRDEALGADGELPLQPYTVFTTASGVKIGMFGLTTTSSPPTDSTTPFKKLGTIATAQKYVDILKNEEGCDIIVALGHTGWPDNDDTFTAVTATDVNSYQVAMQVPGIDLYIDGHTHSVIGEGKGYVCDNENGTLIVQTGCFGDNIGVVTLTVDTASRAIVEKSASQMSSAEYEASYTADPAVATLVEKRNDQIDDLLGRVVGHTDYFLCGERASAAEDGMGIRMAEENLGNLIADAIRAATDADISWFSGVRIRASIEAGDITLLELYNVFANGGTVVEANMTGAQIKSSLKAACSSSAKGQESPGFRQVSGISFVYDTEGNILYAVLDDGREIVDDETYVVTGEFGVAPSGATELWDGDADLVNLMVNYLASDHYDSSRYEVPQGRMTLVEAGTWTPPADSEDTIPTPEGTSTAPDETPKPDGASAAGDNPMNPLPVIIAIISAIGIAAAIIVWAKRKNK